MSNNIPVNGWPQLKDLEAVQPTLDRLDKIESWKRTVKEETFTGEEITIPNALALPARSLITEINAIQDLHGYDKPWSGGSGKNKLPLVLADIKLANTSGTWSDNVYTINGGTITIDTDVDGNVIDIKANGTFTERTVLYIVTRPVNNYHPTSGSYIVNKSYQNTDTTITVDAYNNNTWVQTLAKSSSVDDVQFTVDYSGYDRLGIYLAISSGVSANNIIFKPMIRLATESDPTFAPYSNVCPISGRDRVVLTRSDGDEISEDFTIQLGQTVYGADINWDMGEGTLKTALVTLTGASSEAWDLSGNNMRANTQAIKTLVKTPLNNDIIANIKSSAFVAMSANNTYRGTEGAGISVDTGGQLSVCDGKGGMTVAGWTAYLVENPLQVEYELATPTTIQLTPTQLQMLKGYNRVTLSDGYGTIELKALTGANWS